MKKCKEGHYYCYQDSKCKPIPKGFRRGVGGYLRREREDEKEDSKKNGNGNGKSNGSSNGNGNGGNGSGNGNGGSGGNGGGNGSGGVGESVEIQNSDGETTAVVVDIVGPAHMKPAVDGNGVWKGTNITEVSLNPSQFLGALQKAQKISRTSKMNQAMVDAGKTNGNPNLTKTDSKVTEVGDQPPIDSVIAKKTSGDTGVRTKKQLDAIRRLFPGAIESSYKPEGELVEKKKISDKALFPFKANVKIKNEIISDTGISTKNPIKKKFSKEHYDWREDLGEDWQMYWLSLVALGLATWFLRRLSMSRFGMVLHALRQNETRLKAIGVPPYPYMLVAFVLAGALAGLSGALLTNHMEFVSPDFLHWTRSGDLLIMVILGGIGTWTGPILGAIVFLLLEEFLPLLFQEIGLYLFSEHWRLVFGPLLIGIVLFAKGGLHALVFKQMKGVDGAFAN